jgi:Asp-tRNA(Asn)/Glu-tRNA(Gln) amidotransferase C subunit
MTQDEVSALARVALVTVSEAEAAVLAAVLTPLLARIAGLPASTAEEAQSTRANSPLRTDVPGAALPREVALAGVPAHAGGLVLARPLAARTAGDAP